MSKGIERIEVDKEGNVTFYFYNSDEPFSASEFVGGSATASALGAIENMIDVVDMLQQG